MKLKFDNARQSMPGDLESLTVSVLFPANNSDTVLPLTVNGAGLEIESPWRPISIAESFTLMELATVEPKISR
jgi:hypothetical protein